MKFFFHDGSSIYWLIISVFVFSFFTMRHYLVKKRIKKDLGSTHFFYKNRLRRVFGLNDLFLLIALGCFSVALLNPIWGKQTKKVNSQGIQLVILFDVSRSMWADDIKPSRLFVAKKETLKLLQQLKGNQVGLVAFAGGAAPLAPMTQDIGALSTFVDSLSTHTISMQGTNFTDAFTAAKEIFEKSKLDLPPGQKMTRAVVVISDGEFHDEAALDKAEGFIKEMGIRVFSVGVGTAEGSQLPVKNASGQLMGYLRDNDRNIVVSKVNLEFLKSLSERGKGSFFQLQYGSSFAEKLRGDLDKLEQIQFKEEKQGVEGKRFFVYFIFTGLLFLLLWFSEKFLWTALNLKKEKKVSDWIRS